MRKKHMRRPKFLPWWKKGYREDIGRGRHRRYSLENTFAVDLSSMQAFRALRAKLARDYLMFFRNLEKAYPTGELGEETKAASKLVIATLRLVDRSIAFEVLQKEDVEDIIANVDVLNAQRDFFVRRAEESQPLKEEIEKTEEETGISPESLNITKEMIHRGARIERKRARRRAVPLARRMSRTFGLGAELGKGLGVAALGPFYPIAEMLGGPLREIFGLGKGMLRRKEERGLRKLLRPQALGYEGRGARPRALGYPEEGLRRGARLREVLPSIFPLAPGIRRVTEPLWQFFDKEAYRAKWTKELLQRIKELGRVQKEKGGGGLLDNLAIGIKGALAAIGITTIAGGLAIGALTVGTAVITTLIAKEFAKELGGLINDFKNWAKEDKERVKRLEELPVISPVTGKPYSAASRRRKAELIAEAKQPQWLKTLRSFFPRAFPTPGVSAPPPEIIPPSEKMERIGPRGLTRAAAGVWGPALFPQHSTLGAFSGMDKQIEKLSKAMDNLSNQMGPRRTQPSIKEPGLGDPFDSADALLSEYTAGRLTLEER
jgi:hypothetical protein